MRTFIHDLGWICKSHNYIVYELLQLFYKMRLRFQNCVGIVQPQNGKDSGLKDSIASIIIKNKNDLYYYTSMTSAEQNQSVANTRSCLLFCSGPARLLSTS